MEKINGIQQIGLRRYEIFYDFSPESESEYQLRKVVEHKPTIEEAKQIVIGHINTVVQEKILQKLTYQGYMVWLSAENQRNITFAYAMAKGGDLTVLPTIKLGSDEDFIYYTFSSAEEVITFATMVQEHIEDCLQEGRGKKDEIDWNDYVI